ncbi:glycosyltransferase family 2 protein [Aurantimicrobium minutum]|uniref:glycosyltransferase family 2 protein n=1 Tax=Aurantimicrobium minutum TaxID=708131 RepID=UPI002474C3DE|nr:glycosyltransferase family 2 protein [Aurantimicrobium minutum]MDH6423825.1 glycosyltransferase involved in cell wall biosynthesis [Aurantimicrobium minutum]
MKISVAMCTYNGAKYVEEQLSSILKQSLLPSEIVISDDGSTDETLDIIESFWSKKNQTFPLAADVSLTVIKNPLSLGVTKNFEQALLACQHPILALSDQDDIWQPDKLEKLVPLFEKDPKLLFVFTDSRLVDAAGKPLGVTSFQALVVSETERTAVTSGNSQAVFLRRNLATGATVLLRRNLLDYATPFPSEWVHDEWLALVASFAGQVHMSDECLIDYRQHGNNQIGMKKPGLRHYVGRLVFPRTERNTRLFARAKAMNSHPYFLNDQGDAHNAAAGKLAHERARQELPAKRLKRIRYVLEEKRTGRYDTFGLGLQDVVRDLIQPV